MHYSILLFYSYLCACKILFNNNYHLNGLNLYYPMYCSKNLLLIFVYLYFFSLKSNLKISHDNQLILYALQMKNKLYFFKMKNPPDPMDKANFWTKLGYMNIVLSFNFSELFCFSCIFFANKKIKEMIRNMGRYRKNIFL